jgi:site-specific DNA recombinase
LNVSADAASQRDLAAKEGLDERYVSRLLPLAFLSPEITEAILEGTQPQHWCLDTLLGRVPLNWQDQRKLLVCRDKQQIAENNDTIRVQFNNASS